MTKEFVNVFPEIVVVVRRELIFGIHWDEIWNWSREQGIDVTFRNHWQDETGHNYSFEIPDEQQRTWFALKFK